MSDKKLIPYGATGPITRDQRVRQRAETFAQIYAGPTWFNKANFVKEREIQRMIPVANRAVFEEMQEAKFIYGFFGPLPPFEDIAIHRGLKDASQEAFY